MRVSSLRYLLLFGTGVLGTFSLSCQPTPGNVNANINANTAVSNTASNLSNANLAASTGPSIDAREPEQYQATMKFSLEALGDQQRSTFPPVVANVARSGDNRVME